MDKKRASGFKQFFTRFAADSTMRLIVGDGDRDKVFFLNEGPATVYCGKTGTPTTDWMALPSGQSHNDQYSNDNWWVYAPSSSGTISGYIVQGG